MKRLEVNLRKGPLLCRSPRRLAPRFSIRGKPSYARRWPIGLGFSLFWFSLALWRISDDGTAYTILLLCAAIFIGVEALIRRRFAKRIAKPS